MLVVVGQQIRSTVKCIIQFSFPLPSCNVETKWIQKPIRRYEIWRRCIEMREIVRQSLFGGFLNSCLKLGWEHIQRREEQVQPETGFYRKYIHFHQIFVCLSLASITFFYQIGFSGLRLSGSSAPNAGRMEIKIHGVWGTIGIRRLSRLVRSFLLTKVLRFTCRQLGYNGGFLGVRWMQIGLRRRLIWLLLNCGEKETNIGGSLSTLNCIYPPQPHLRLPSYYFAQDLGVICKPNVSQIKGEIWTLNAQRAIYVGER